MISSKSKEACYSDTSRNGTEMEMKTLMFDLSIRLYTPHREFILSELFKEKYSNLRVNLSDFSIQKLEQEIEEKLENFKPDVVFIDPWVLFPGKRDTSFQNANLVADKDFIQKCQIIANSLRNNKTKLKVILGPWMDVHSLNQEDSEILQLLLSRKDFYLWGLAENDFIDYDQPTSEARKATRPHTRFFRDLILETDRKEKIIPYLHSIPSNFYHRSHTSKKSDDFEFIFHVPGSLGAYPDRQVVRKKVMESSTQEYHMLVTLNESLRASFNQVKSQFLLDTVNYTYYDLIKKSRYNYVDGGRMQYVTMKYLEVPICGSVLLSPENTTLKKYGLVSNTHYLRYDKDLHFNFNEKEWNLDAHRIRENAYRLIIEKHTTEIRIKQFRFMLKHIFDFEEVYNFTYDNGTLLYNENQIFV